jgi:hypothetical protein
MNIEKKILRLLEHGFNTSTLADLKPKQIEALYNRLVEAKEENKEQSTPQNTTATSKTITSYEVKPNSKTMVNGLEVDTTGGKTRITPLKEIDDTETEDIALAVSEKDPDLGLAMSEDLKEKFESKKQQKYFFAKCGDGKTKEQKKWCKMAKEFADSTKNFSKLPEKKDETNEDFSFKNYLEKVGSTIAGNIAKEVPNSLRPTFEGKLEESIMNMVNKHITPKMTKKDFIKTITEAEREVETPVKPDVKPERPRPQTPYQPKHKPAPKAGEKEVETPVKPDVKPERPRPATPYQPKHKPAPKAEDIPQWITFDAIGINLK